MFIALVNTVLISTNLLMLLSNSATITDLKMIVQTSEECILVPWGHVLCHLNVFVFEDIGLRPGNVPCLSPNIFQI